MLVQNLLYDISQVGIPFDRVDEEYLEQPRKWEVGDIGRFMLFIGPISSIFDITTFAVLWFVFGANTPDKQALFQSGWFIEGLLSQTLIIHMIRTREDAVLPEHGVGAADAADAGGDGGRRGDPVFAAGAGRGTDAAAGDILPGLPHPPGYCASTQLVKSWYIRRFGTWL